MFIKYASQLCIKTCDFRQSLLIFVRRSVNYCNAVARAIVALLGRFLPRLGPLANASGPFFGYSAAARYGRSSSSGISPRRRGSGPAPRRSVRGAAGERVERAGARVAALVHVKRAVDLELDGMQAGSRVA